MLLCSALEQKVLILLKIHRWFWKAVANQIDENEDTIKQIGPNMLLTPVWCHAFLLCFRTKGSNFIKNSWAIQKGCCESNWWKRGHNKTNSSQYDANTSVMWCFFAVL